MDSNRAKTYTKMIEMFLKNGADPNISDEKVGVKSTLLDLAVITENVNLVNILLDSGANPNFCAEGCYQSSLAIACEGVDLEIMELLIWL